MTDKIILQKFIAQSGLYSRRQAEELIRRGKVMVNGEKAELGMKADEQDDMRVNGKRVILAKEKIYIILNKPKGYVCTNRRFPGEKNVFELLNNVETNGRSSLHIVGRLDKDSRGLVLLTNDGDLAMKLTHPRYGYNKIYEVEITSKEYFEFNGETKRNWKLSASQARREIGKLANKLEQGVDIGEEDGMVKAKRARYLGEGKFEIVLTEGKKRQIRRMFRVFGYRVEDLVRTAIGPIRLGNLLEGKWRHLPKNEIRKFRN
jgi:pseudouridine synthase